MVLTNKLRTTLLTLTIITVALASGCSLGNDKTLDLPEKPRSFEKKTDDSSDSCSITVDGRTYIPFGKPKGKIDNKNSIRECLGYIDNDKNTRVYTLYQDPYDNYLMIKNVDGIMDQVEFWRDLSTRKEDIFTPEYISSFEYEEWIGSDIHYEMKTVDINTTIDMDDAVIISMFFTINGEPGGEIQSGYTNGDPLDKGSIHSFAIDEVNIDGKVEYDEPFDTDIAFVITDKDDNMYEVNGTYSGTVTLGDEIELTISGDHENGYSLSSQK